MSRTNYSTNYGPPFFELLCIHLPLISGAVTAVGIIKLSITHLIIRITGGSSSKNR